MGSKKHSEISQYKNFETKIGHLFLNKNNNNNISNNNNINNNNNNNRHKNSPTKFWANGNSHTKGISGPSLRTLKCSCLPNIQITPSDGEDRPPCRSYNCKKYENDQHQQQVGTGVKRRDKVKDATPSLNKIYAVLGLIAVTINLNGLFGSYVHDDVSVVLRNPDVQGKTPLWGLFLNDFWGTRMTNDASHKSFRPLTILSFRIEHWLVGSSCAFVSHAVNVLLHLLVTLLYANVLHSCLRLKPSHVLYSGAMFALHPIHTEAVTGIVGRADVLAALAFLAAFYSYCKLLEVFCPFKVCLWTVGFAMSVCFGILCKETAITVIPVCLLWDFLIFMGKINNKWRKITKETLSPLNTRLGWLILLASFLLLLRILVMRSAPVFSKQDNPASFSKSFQTRFLSYLFLPSLNLWLMLYPWRLSHDWQLGSVPPVEELSDYRNIASASLFIGLVLLLCRALLEKNKDSNVVIWAVVVMVFSFLPASNIFFRVGFVVAERILYTPSIGFCALFGVGISRVEECFKRRTVRPRATRTWWVVRAWAVVLLLLFAVRTVKRNADWLSRESLLQAGLRALPHNAKMHYNFANACRDRGRYDAAVDHYREAVRLWPDYPSAHNNLGAVYHELGQSVEAEHHFRQALQYQSHHIHATTNLASLLRREKRRWEAISLIYKTLDSHGDFSGDIKSSSEERVKLSILLADLYADEGLERLEEEVYLRLLTEFPHSADIQTYYGNFLVKQGKYEAAPRHFEAALSLNPQHSGALTSYAALLEAQFHPSQAQTLYTQALELGWDADTATSLGKAHLSQGRLEEAEKVLSKVLNQNPHHLGANVHLAQIRLQQRHYQLSEALLRDVLRAAPDDRQALYHLSLVFATTNRSAESLLTARRAARGCVRPRAFCAALLAHLGDLLHTNAMLEAAVENYRKALDLEPSLVKAHINLGAIYHSQGNFSHAWDHYIEVLKLDPENTLVLENIWKLQQTLKSSAQSLFEGS